MRPLPLSRWLPRPVQVSSVRNLTTRPRRIPVFVNQIDYSKQSFRPSPASSAADDAAPTAQHGSLDVRQDITKEAAAGSVGSRASLKTLNKYLRLTESSQFDEKYRARLWRTYSLTVWRAPHVISMLTDYDWIILWTSESTYSTPSHIRRSHLEKLYSDMRLAGRSMTGHMKAVYLESMFFSGQNEEQHALVIWEDDRASAAQAGHSPSPEYLECGARIHAYAGNAQRACEIMEELFDKFPAWDSTIMLAVFRSHTRSTAEEDHNTAYNIYLRMKERTDKMTLRHYNAIFVGFVEARQLQYAKRVFRHMVDDGQLAIEYSTFQVNEVLKKLHILYRLGTDISKATSIALHAIAVLPQPFHPHIFGDWLRSAVVAKAPEAAAQILQMMFKKGYQPETFHFNMLLRALLRTKERQDEVKVENIGWQMIDMCHKTDPRPQARAHAAEAIIEREKLDIRPATDKLSHAVPRANIGTFALLMHHHANHAQWEHVDYLIRHMEESGLHPNVDVLNVLIDSDCRKGRYARAFDTYRTLCEVPEGTPGVFPNGATFRILWRSLRLALGSRVNGEMSTLPSPRELLAQNARWWDSVRRRPDAERFRIGSAAPDHGALNSLIMHCFSYVSDLPGSLVAMHILRRYFDIFPSNKAAQIIQRHVAWVDLHRETKNVRAQYSRSSLQLRKIEQMGHVYHILMDARFKSMDLTGDGYAYMSDEQKGDLGLNLLSEFVRVVLKRQHNAENVEAMIDQAKQDMGVPTMATGDKDAFAVL